MAKIAVFDINNQQVSERELAEDVFNVDVKGYLIHDMVRYQLAKRRQGTACTKGRSEVARSGRKPFKQKGTGNARQGMLSAPIHVGGGTVFGPKPRSYAFKLNRKVKKAALKCALSARFKENKLTVLNDVITSYSIHYTKLYDVAISYSTAPAAYRSVRASTPRPRSCSGDM